MKSNNFWRRKEYKKETMQRIVSLRLVIKPGSELGYNFLKSDLGGGWPSKGTCLRVWPCDGRRELTLSNSMQLRHRGHDTLGLCKHVINNCPKKMREKKKRAVLFGGKSLFYHKVCQNTGTPNNCTTHCQSLTFKTEQHCRQNHH